MNVAALAAALVGIAAVVPGSGNFFERGEFDRAKTAYANAVSHDPRDPEAVLGLARIELYQNHLHAAASYATRLLVLRPGDEIAKRLLQTVAERRSILASAASLDVPDAGVVIPFLESEPLPAIRLLVDGKPGTFLIDTGGPDITLDPDFARECGLTLQAGAQGTFLGGKTAEVRRSVADRIDAGSITLRNANVTVLPLRGMRLFEHRTIDGVIGTVFLSRFQSTIDYPRHRLLLRPRTARPVKPAAGTAIPMWLVGDHFIFAEGSVNGLARQLFSVDSGGAGVGFMPAEATIAAAHVKTSADNAFQAVGGGGPATVIPTLADRVCLGDVCQSEVSGGYTPGGSPLSIFPFAVSGTVSDGFLRKYAVTFDFARMRITLARQSS